MRRWFLLLLLCLLPFQSSWASASAYCQHEHDTQPAHWGHHDSQLGGTDRSHGGDGAQKNSSTQPNAAVGEGAVWRSGCAQHADATLEASPDAHRAAPAVRLPGVARFVSHITDVPLPPARPLAA